MSPRKYAHPMTALLWFSKYQILFQDFIDNQNYVEQKNINSFNKSSNRIYFNLIKVVAKSDYKSYEPREEDRECYGWLVEAIEQDRYIGAKKNSKSELNDKIASMRDDGFKPIEIIMALDCKPHTVHNVFNRLRKKERMLSLHEQGYSDEYIAKELGYKSAGSVRGALWKMRDEITNRQEFDMDALLPPKTEE